jgi:hypothetical protein
LLQFQVTAQHPLSMLPKTDSIFDICECCDFYFNAWFTTTHLPPTGLYHNYLRI